MTCDPSKPNEQEADETGAPPAPESKAATETPASVPNRFERRATAAADAIRTLLRDLYMGSGGAQPEGGPREGFELNLRLWTEPSEAWALRFDPPLIDQLRERLGEVQALRDVVQEGRVFCYRCEQSDCTHAKPPNSVSVFRGYEANGLPIWSEWTQALLDLQDERVDTLYTPRPAILARMVYGREMRSRLLHAFGRTSKTYVILGQVMAGYFHAGGERVALTFQAVEARNAGGLPLVTLNPLVHLPPALTLEEWLADERQHGLARAFAMAQRAFHALQRELTEAALQHNNEKKHRVLRRVPGILRTLAESLERGGRQDQRRTRHVEHRRQQHRPVHKAREDAERAGDQAFFFDTRHKTFAVCGAQGRAHVFNKEGRHVTSFVLPPDGTETRLRTGRWQRLNNEELTQIRRAIDSAGRHEGNRETLT